MPERTIVVPAPLGFTAMLLRVSLVFAALLAFGFAAVGPALGQAAPAAQPAPPVPNCEKPGDPPSVLSTESGRQEAERKRNSWAKNMRTYVECLKRFIEEEQATAAAHIKAVNAAAEEYTKASKTYNEQMEAARPQ